MATSRRYFPPKQDALPLFATCVFIVYSWAIFAFLDKVPSWLLYQNYWDLLGVFAYGLVFALLDSLLPFVALIILGAILPGWLLRNHIVALGGLIVLITAIWSAVFQNYASAMNTWSMQRLLMWVILYFVSIAVAYVLVRRFDWLQDAIRSIADRLTVFLYLYVPLTIISIFVIIIRNI